MTEKKEIVSNHLKNILSLFAYSLLAIVILYTYTTRHQIDLCWNISAMQE